MPKVTSISPTSKVPAKVANAAPNVVANPTEIEFLYKFSDSYTPTYANGVIGGVGTQGEIILNFYVERHALPLIERHALTARGELGAMTSREPALANGRVPVIRCVSQGTMLSLEVAKQVHEFLGKRIEELEKFKDKKAK